VRLLEDLRAVVRFLGLRAAVVLLRVVRLRAVPFRLRVAAAFFAPRDLAADFRFLVAAAFFAAADRLREVVRRAVDLRVVRLRAADFFRVDFLRAVAMFTSFRAQDAIRFRRRLSRSLIPPHTPYRSSRRNA
jgi:hypothetical protein